MTAVLETPALSRKERRRQRREYTAHAEAGRGRELSLVAAAVDVRTESQWMNQRWGGGEWQTEGWLHYDTCAEFRSGVDLRASAMSRCRMVGVAVDAETGELGTEATNDPDVRDIMAQLFGGPTGQSQCLASMSRHWDVAGDYFVLASPTDEGMGWQIVGTSEVLVQSGGRVQVLAMDGMWREVDLENELMVRLWNPHPARRWEANSMTRALLPVLRELAALTAMVSSTVKSRLASAGILWLPDNLTPPRTDTAAQASDVPSPTPASQANYWLDLLTEAMTTPIGDPDSAAAVVPIVATVTAEKIALINHMEFGRDLDENLEPIRAATVGRLGVGMSLPVEYMTGQGDINHWTGWLIAEDFRRIYLAPPAEAWADALTRYYLRPMLAARGKDPTLFAVAPSFNKLQPEQITMDNATVLYQAGLMRETTYVERLGSSAADIPEPAERGRRLLVQLIATGNAEAIAALAGVIPQMYPGTAQLDVPIPEVARVTETGPAPANALPPAGGAPPAATGGAPNGGTPPPPPTGTPG